MLNRFLRLSVLLILTVTPIGAISISYWKSGDNQVDPHWRDEVFYDCGELENKPEVTVDPLYRSGAKVTLSNTGHTTLCYSGYGFNHIRTFQEFYTRGKWKKHDWEWCGTGASEFEILPNASVTFEIWFREDERRERILGGFGEKGTNRSGLVVLATEP
jgi:hypothetical protein